MSHVGDAELAELFERNFRKHIAEQLEQWSEVIAQHVDNGQGICRECFRPMPCFDLKYAQEKHDHWTNVGLRVMDPQPGDQPSVKK